MSKPETSDTWLPFEEARQIARSLNIRSARQWEEFMKSDKRPKNIPVNPRRSYINDWKGFEDFLGNNNKKNNRWLPFEEARQITRSLNLKSAREWDKFMKSDKRPKNIPSNPRRTYIDNWKGFEDFLGNSKSHQN